MLRLLQFRLRSLFAAVTILAVPCAWVGGELRSWQADLQALAALQPNHVAFEEAGQIPLPLLT